MRRSLTLALFVGLLLSACDSQAPQLSDTTHDDAPGIELRVPPATPMGKKSPTAADDDRTEAVQAYIAQVNDDLAERGLGIAVERIEWVGGGESHEAGQTVFANDRQLRLSSQWVSGDPNRNADGDNITHVVDQSFGTANTFNPQPPLNGEPAIDASFDTWNGVNCSKLNIVKLPDVGINYSAILATGEPTDIFYADISTVGFIPGSLFDAVLGPGSSDNVLGVTFTFVWIDENGDPTDINSDGYDDVALKEVWYNDSFGWSTNGTLTDIETVALHENGHALGLGHFGKVFVTTKNNKLHVAPRAVMNAFILGTLQEPLGTDNGAYCGIYASWPN